MLNDVWISVIMHTYHKCNSRQPLNLFVYGSFRQIEENIEENW